LGTGSGDRFDAVRGGPARSGGPTEAGAGEFTGEYEEKNLQIGTFLSGLKTAAASKRPLSTTTRLLHEC
jgi:hypothetical protein